MSKQDKQAKPQVKTAQKQIAKQKQPQYRKVIRHNFDKWGPQLVGLKTFANIRDLIFFTANSDKQYMLKHKQYLNKIKYQTIASMTILPISLLINLALQRKFPNQFGGLKLRNMIFDFIWYTAFGYLTLKAAEISTKQNKFQEIKNQLITNKIPAYLLYINENIYQHKIPLELQLSEKQYNSAQLINIKDKIEKIVEEAKRNQGKKQIKL